MLDVNQVTQSSTTNAPAPQANPFEQAALELLAQAVVTFTPLGVAALMGLITKAIQGSKS